MVGGESGAQRWDLSVRVEAVAKQCEGAEKCNTILCI